MSRALNHTALTSCQPIGPLDMLIAAHALSRQLILVTRNVAKFSRVPSLDFETW
jgi:tRNA(fMet)-specific endonuclease VapC